MGEPFDPTEGCCAVGLIGHAGPCDPATPAQPMTTPTPEAVAALAEDMAAALNESWQMVVVAGDVHAAAEIMAAKGWTNEPSVERLEAAWTEAERVWEAMGPGAASALILARYPGRPEAIAYEANIFVFREGFVASAPTPAEALHAVTEKARRAALSDSGAET